MRRFLIITAVVGFAALAGSGCKNATHGRCDCQYDPANAQLAAPSNPYPTVGTPVSSSPKMMAAPALSTMPGTTGTTTLKSTPAPAPMLLPQDKN